VICIGNLVAGGSGKTPAAIALVRLMHARIPAENPFFLSRGFGGTEKGPLRLDPAVHGAARTGDEPLLLARTAPVIIARNRAEGAKYAETRTDATCLVMDDGFQNTALVKTRSFIVIDGGAGFGNGLVLPAGPLREPLAEGLSRTDAFIFIGADKMGVLPSLPAGKPVFHVEIGITPGFVLPPHVSHIAFCGLGRPEKFRQTLTQQGANIMGWHPFADHHRYTEKEMQMLVREARAKKARLITTEKDAVRLPAAFARHELLDILPVTLSFTDEEALAGYLSEALSPPLSATSPAPAGARDPA